MHVISKKIMLLSMAFLLALAGNAQINNRKLAEDMLAKMAQIKTLKYRLYKKERLTDGKFRESEMQIKYQKSPFACYIYMYSPDPGVEVLYAEGVNNNKAFVNPNKKMVSFIDFDFDPMGKTLRKDEHHTVFENGFEYMRGILKATMKIADDEGKFDEYYKIDGEVDFKGRKCHKVILTYPKFAWENYTVKSGEDLVKIARANHLSEYMILAKNKLSFYNSVKAGQVIKIPNIYAKKVIFYVDKINLMPIYQEVHDDQGLFEEYHYINLLVNTPIPAEEFTKNFKDYKF
ncbi:MAG: DUF1571 domain-containing protein [Flavobacteriales bacterium]|nr:DUF1571 domain-containing protein [Flavobacteriales bacterium]